MGHKTKRFGIGTLSIVTLALGLCGCGASSEPGALSDDEQQVIVDLVQDQGTDFDAPSCQVEVFRIDDPNTFGWATCTETQKVEAQPVAQAIAFPFRITGDKVQKPADGKQFEQDVKKLFPEDLWTAVDQHQRGA